MASGLKNKPVYELVVAVVFVIAFYLGHWAGEYTAYKNIEEDICDVIGSRK